MNKRIGVCFSGCGVNDGSEIHESVMTILSLDSHNIDIIYLAPDIKQTNVNNHLNDSNTDEERNVLIESARIARGHIKDISKLSAKDLDAIIFPGGFGAALNLCNFGQKGSSAEIQEDVFNIIRDMIENNKPIGAICIAPAMLACALRDMGLGAKLTIGNDKGVADQINLMGSIHIDCPVDGIVVDNEMKIISTPAYMLATRISEAADGINKLVNKIVEII